MKETADSSAGRFRAAWRGYDRQEVEAFLTAADLKASRLERDLTRMETLLTEHRDKERSLHNVLVSAETMADQIREKAQQEALEIVRTARGQAEGVLHAAREEVETIRQHSEVLKVRRQETAAALESVVASLTTTLESVRADNAAERSLRFEPQTVAAPPQAVPPIRTAPERVHPERIQHERTQTDQVEVVASPQPETIRFNPSRALNPPEFILPAPADWVRAAAMKPTYEGPSVPVPEIARVAPLRQIALWLAAGVVFTAVLLYLWMGGSRQVGVSSNRPVAAAHPVQSGSPVGTVGAVILPEKAAPAASNAAPESDEFTIELRSKSPSWVSVTVDGERVGSRLMNPGEQAVLRAHDAIVLRVGDAGALTMTINGQPARLLGESGQAVTTRIDKTNFKGLLVAK